MQRKAQLDAMLGDSQRYEAKRQEVDAWLTRMETRLERMGNVGHTADVLEAQLREQKVRVLNYIRRLYYAVFNYSCLFCSCLQLFLRITQY